MVSHPNPKAAVALIREAFTSRESSIKTRDAYNLLAQLWGHKDWATAKAVLANEPSAQGKEASVFAKPLNYVEGWPTLVFTNRGGHVDEPLYMQAPGVTLEKLYGGPRYWHLINDQKYPTLEVPFEPFEGKPLQDLLVGEEIACAYWDSEEYGYPMAANEREAHLFLSEELGWGYVADKAGRSLVEVTSRSRGDDGCVEWWVQARVHPELYAQLVKDFSPARWELERLLQNTSMQDLLKLDASAHPGLAQVQQGINACFSQVGETPFYDQLDRLEGFFGSAPSKNALYEDCVLREGVSAIEEVEGLLGCLKDALEQARETLRG